MISPRRTRVRTLLALFTVVLAVGGSATAGDAIRAAASTAKIIFVDVGQGDGVVLKVADKIIVSDAGEAGKAGTMHAALNAVGANKKIHVAILSHGHDDHVGGFERLLEQFGYDIEVAVLSENVHWSRTKTNRKLLAALDKHEVTIKWVKDGFSWGGGAWKVLSPPGNAFLKDGDVENSSVVVLLTTNGKKILFTGDIKEQASAALAQGWSDGTVDVFFVTHHGSGAGSPDSLLEKIKPQFAVLSARSSKIFAASTASRLKSNVGAAIYCTDTNGTITATIAADEITWSTSKPGPPWWTKASGQTAACAGR